MAHSETSGPLGETMQYEAADVTTWRSSPAEMAGDSRESSAGGSTDVVVGRLDVARDAVREFARMLSSDEQRRAARFAFPHDARRFIVGRARLRQVLATRLGAEPADVEFIYGTRGKPALAPACAASDLRFNVAHCDDVIVIALSRGRDVGIDVEAVRPMGDADAVVSHFFSRAEQAAYAALAPCDRVRGFFNCWTRKEAFIKATGDGLHFPLDQFDVTLTPDEPARILRIGSTPGDQCGWTLHSFAAGPTFAGAVVVRQRPADYPLAAPDRLVVRSHSSAVAAGSA